ncbi:MAG: response regulator transcription factor [Proteobacteria bacterium]|nr:response regulator transcription factor [Pseudomonadota bacterium]
MVRLLIVEDDRELRDVLSALLLGSGYEVAAHADAAAALKAAALQAFDLAIIDWNLPGMSGIELIQHLRAGSQDTPILIITARLALADRVTGLDSGADDYLIKPFQMRELEARVRALLRRKSSSRTTLIRVGPLTLSPGDPRIRIRDEPINLPPREFALLELLADRVGGPISKQAIAARLNREGDPISDGAVEIYVHRLRRRLEPFGLNIRTLRGYGYVLQPPETES